MDDMTVGEFYNFYAQSEIKVISGYNRKVLCKSFNLKKHKHIAHRVITSVWAEIVIVKGIAFDNTAKPIICVYVDGMEELIAEEAKKGQK